MKWENGTAFRRSPLSDEKEWERVGYSHLLPTHESSNRVEVLSHYITERHRSVAWPSPNRGGGFRTARRAYCAQQVELTRSWSTHEYYIPVQFELSFVGTILSYFVFQNPILSFP